MSIDELGLCCFINAKSCYLNEEQKKIFVPGFHNILSNDNDNVHEMIRALFLVDLTSEVPAYILHIIFHLSHFHPDLVSKVFLMFKSKQLKQIFLTNLCGTKPLIFSVQKQ